MHLRDAEARRDLRLREVGEEAQVDDLPRAAVEGGEPDFDVGARLGPAELRLGRRGVALERDDARRGGTQLLQLQAPSEEPAFREAA